MGDERVVEGWAEGPEAAVPQADSDTVWPAASAAVATPYATPGPDAADEPGCALARVEEFRTWLATVDVHELTDAERISLLTSLESVKGAASAAQARATDAFRCSQEHTRPQDCARSVGSQIALARPGHCARCNHVKDAPDWQVDLVHTGLTPDSLPSPPPPATPTTPPHPRSPAGAGNQPPIPTNAPTDPQLTRDQRGCRHDPASGDHECCCQHWSSRVAS